MQAVKLNSSANKKTAFSIINRKLISLNKKLAQLTLHRLIMLTKIDTLDQFYLLAPQAQIDLSWRDDPISVMLVSALFIYSVFNGEVDNHKQTSGLTCSRLGIVCLITVSLSANLSYDLGKLH